MSTAETFDRAAEAFKARVDATAPDQWGNATPCRDWDVRTLVNHVASELRWITPMLDGKTIAEVGDRLDGDLLGDDPQRAFGEAVREATSAASAPEALAQTVHLSFGDREADSYIREVTTDLVIHSWDLARGIGAHDRLDAGLVAFAQTTLEPQAEAWRAGGAFGPAVEVAADADAQTRLLAITGRRADAPVG